MSSARPSPFARGFQSFALLIARLVCGGVLFAHAWYRWIIAGIDPETAFLSAHGVPWANVIIWVTIAFEGLGGAALVFGVLTRLVGLALLVEQVLVICWTKFYRGLYVHTGGYEYNAVLGVAGLLLLAFGAGVISIDALFRRSPRTDRDDGNL